MTRHTDARLEWNNPATAVEQEVEAYKEALFSHFFGDSKGSGIESEGGNAMGGNICEFLLEEQQNTGIRVNDYAISDDKIHGLCESITAFHQEYFR